MALTDQSTVIGVFRDRALAEQAIGELRHAGFRDEEISLLGNGSAGDVLTSLKSLLSGQHPTSESVSDRLISLGVAEQDVPFYQHEVEAGNTIVAVQTYGHQQEADRILYHYGAYNTSALPVALGGKQTIPVRREELQVHKHVVPTGEIRIHKRVITEEKTFRVPVTREELVIEHVQFPDQPSHLHYDDQSIVVEHRPTSDASTLPSAEDNEILQNGGVVRIVLHEEQVNITKQTVATEEIVIKKQQVEEIKEISDTVKREEVRIVRRGNVIIQGDVADVEDETNVPSG